MSSKEPRRVHRNKAAEPHRRNYKTFYISPSNVDKIDALKVRWRLDSRGKVVERLLHKYFAEQEAYSESELKSRV